MTVIAYSRRSGVMAADSRCSDDGGYHLTTCRKIVRLRSGALLGIAGDGDARDMQEILEDATPEDLPSRGELVQLAGEYRAILAFKTACFLLTVEWQSESSNWYAEVIPIEDDYVCVGTGAPFAYGALDAGANVSDAVGAACKRDLKCGLPIQVETV